MGTSSSANGNFAFSIGNSCTANNDFSFAFGNSVTTNGAFSFGVGNSNTVDGNFAFAAGNSNLAGGNNSFVAGKSNNAGGHCSFAAGDNVTAGGNFSTAFGNRIAALADRSMVLGYGDGGILTNNITNSLMIGMNSDLPTLFVGPSAGTGTTGNVGIGTTDATQKLTVAGMIRSTTGGVMFPDGSVMTTAGVVNGNIDTLTVDTLHVNKAISVGSGTLVIGGNQVYTNDGTLFLSSRPQFGFNTVINANNEGKVGIGKIAPLRKLHLFETINTSTNGSSTGIRIEQFDIATSNTVFWDIATFGGQLRFSNVPGGVEGQASAMTLFPNGMSIGKPDFQGSYEGGARLKLDVAGDGRFGPDDNNYLRIGFNGSAIIDNFASGGANNLLINHFSGNDVVIANGERKGNVTIGGRLGTGVLPPASVQFVSKAVGTGVGGVEVGVCSLTDYNRDYLFNFKAIANRPLTKGISILLGDESSAVENFVVFADGKTVIADNTALMNFSSNNFKLFVEKGILTDRVKVAVKNSADWSDYILDTNYRLMPLADLESYIYKYRHLPGIPSAEDVVRDGIDLARMDAALLAKIEELTLYMIELKKENEELRLMMQQPGQ